MNKQKESLEKTENIQPEIKESIELPKCGIVMPISPIDGLTAEHWAEVLSILKDAIKNTGFEPNLVSDADDSGIIQKRIIHNLYSNELVVCDVSAKKPNVMFELGMRLAFDKPTIIIKDDKTDYTFDTSIIEHLSYPRDLRFSKINSFKDSLKKKLSATFEKSQKDSNYTTFLKHFGEYKVAHLTEKEITSEKYILNAIDDLRHEMILMRRSQNNNRTGLNSIKRQRQLFIENLTDKYIKENGFVNKFEIFLSNKEEELINYLEKHSDIKQLFNNREELMQFTVSFLNE